MNIDEALNVEYLLDRIQQGLLRDIVEECLRQGHQVDDILDTLFSKLVKGFSFIEFLHLIPSGEKEVFLSDLLYHIFYLHLSVEYLANKEHLRFFLFQVFAVKASSDSIRAVIAQFDKEPLYTFLRKNFDEGSWRVFAAMQESQAHIYSDEDLVHMQELFSAHNMPCNIDEIKTFVYIFGLDGHQESDDEQSFYEAAYRHVKALSNAPAEYIKGIEMMTIALPTKGKELSQFAWVHSTTSALDFFTKHFKLSYKVPVFIFDQSDEPLFAKNRAYMKSLDANIIHIGREAILKLAKRLKIEALLVTDPPHDFGFGGARNAIFLLMPLLKYYYTKGVDVDSVKQDALLRDFQEVVLEEKRGPSVIHMGDDDVLLPRSTFFSDALFAAEHQDEYFARYGYLSGRKTIGIDTTFDLKQLLTKVEDLILQHKMQHSPFSHGMACLLTKPKLCLNVPFGTEEAYLFAMKQYHFDFRETSYHLSGYRFPNKLMPQNRFSGLSDYLSAHYRYIHSMRLVVDLIDPTNRRESSILPWNQKDMPFRNLKEAIQAITQDTTIKEMQTQFALNLSRLNEAMQSYVYNGNDRPEFATLTLKVFDTLDIERELQPYRDRFPEEADELMALFTSLKRDYNRFRELLNGQSIADSNGPFTHPFWLLSEVINKASFQKSLLHIYL